MSTDTNISELDRKVAEYKDNGWTKAKARRVIDTLQEDLDMHLSTCKLCRREQEAYCPIARRIIHHQQETMLILFGLGIHDLGKELPAKRGKAKRK